MKNKKGFTLVELLAVVVILGIIMTVSIPAVSKWINRSKVESKAAQEKTLLLAGQAYAQGNSKVLPKAIGEAKLIKAVDLKKANYLKEDLKDSEKKSCMKDSVVRIYKYDKDSYSYTAYLYCEGDEVPEKITGVPPIIGITFTGDNLKDEVVQDVSKAGFRITIDGNKKDGKNLGIDGYTYSISVKYAGTGEIVEIYNSGSLNGGGKEKLIIEKSLGDYTNITTLSEFMVTVEAYNRDGGYLKQTGNSKYGDNTGPTCGDITGQAEVDQWFKTPRTSTISVKCIDEGNGSGCVKDEFTKSWNTEVEDDYITIEDNAGNKTDCKVRIHHDWTRPVITITAHQNLSGNGKGTQVGSITANNSNNDVTLSSYTGDYGTNHWLNNANFPNGIYYEVMVEDNIHLNKGQWYYNNSGIISFNDTNLNTMKTGSSKVFSVDDNVTHVTLTEEGLRRGRYELTDKAGNKTIIRLEANMDLTLPGCVSSGGSGSWTNKSRTLTGTCSDSFSGCQQATITKVFDKQIDSTKQSPGKVIDNAGNEKACPANQTVRIDKTAPSCSAKKASTGVQSGITVNFSCGDSGGSGLSSCPCHMTADHQRCIADSGLKSSKCYSVSDRAGNSGGCCVSVEEYKECKLYNNCATSSCGQNCGCVGASGGSPYVCATSGGQWKCSNKMCRTKACGCQIEVTLYR